MQSPLSPPKGLLSPIALCCCCQVLSMASVYVGIVAVQETGQAPRVAAQRVLKAV